MIMMWATIIFGIAVMVDSSFFYGMSFMLSIVSIVNDIRSIRELRGR